MPLVHRIRRSACSISRILSSPWNGLPANCSPALADQECPTLTPPVTPTPLTPQTPSSASLPTPAMHQSTQPNMFNQHEINVASAPSQSPGYPTAATSVIACVTAAYVQVSSAPMTYRVNSLPVANHGQGLRYAPYNHAQTRRKEGNVKL